MRQTGQLLLLPLFSFYYYSSRVKQVFSAHLLFGLYFTLSTALSSSCVPGCCRKGRCSSTTTTSQWRQSLAMTLLRGGGYINRRPVTHLVTKSRSQSAYLPALLSPLIKHHRVFICRPIYTPTSSVSWLFKNPLSTSPSTPIDLQVSL